MAAASRMRMRTSPFGVLGGFLLSVLALMLLVACASPAPAVSPIPTASPSPSLSGKTVTIDLTAQGFKFDKPSLSVPAGASVAINFSNADSGVPHNFAVYQTLAGSQTRPVFVGATIIGPARTTYQFTAPAASGTYFFECDVHPTQMNGSFVVIAG